MQRKRKREKIGILLQRWCCKLYKYILYRCVIIEIVMGHYRYSRHCCCRWRHRRRNAHPHTPIKSEIMHSPSTYTIKAIEKGWRCFMIIYYGYKILFSQSICYLLLLLLPLLLLLLLLVVIFVMVLPPIITISASLLSPHSKKIDVYIALILAQILFALFSASETKTKQKHIFVKLSIHAMCVVVVVVAHRVAVIHFFLFSLLVVILFYFVLFQNL